MEVKGGGWDLHEEGGRDGRGGGWLGVPMRTSTAAASTQSSLLWGL